MHLLFPAVPEDLAAADADELRGLLEQFTTVGQALRANEADLKDLTPEQVKEQLTTAVESRKAIEAELSGRDEAEQNYVEDITDLTAQLGVEDDSDDAAEGDAAADALAADADGDGGDDGGDDDGGGDGDEAGDGDGGDDDAAGDDAGEGDGDDAVTAAADEPAPVRRLSIPKGPRRHHARPRTADGLAFTASAGIDGYREGSELSRRDVAEAIIAKRERATSTARGVSENVVVASLLYEDRFPEERRLYSNEGDFEKIQNVVGEEALVASGGWCAPTTPWYDVDQVSVADRPVRDALPDFNARRGGVRFTGAVSIADISTAVGIVTAAQDELGGTFAAKDCQAVDCPDIDEVLLDAIYKCLQFGNMQSRAWPELVEAFVSAASAAHARTAETALIDAIAAASTATTRDAWYGATSTIIQGVLQAVAGLRSRHRMRPDTRFRALLPAWLPDLLQADLAHQGSFDGRFDFTREGIATLLGKYGVRPAWYLDTETGEGQIFDAQTAGALDAFPTTVNGYIFPEGSFTFLDGGRLDLGIVRDSTLNETNDYQIFMETFEALAFTGVESIEIEFTVCPSGTYAPAGTAETC